MPIEDEFKKELGQRLPSTVADSSSFYNRLRRLMMPGEPLSFLFGIGMAPENPNAIVDCLVVTQSHIIGFDIRSDGESTIAITPLSQIRNVSIDSLGDRAKVEINPSGLGGGYYVNVKKEEEEKALAFVSDLQVRLTRL